MYLCIYVIMYLWLCGLGYAVMWLYILYVLGLRDTEIYGGDKLYYVFRVYEIREYIGNLECFTLGLRECGTQNAE